MSVSHRIASRIATARILAWEIIHSEFRYPLNFDRSSVSSTADPASHVDPHHYRR
jgi:hypothetical protein